MLGVLSCEIPYWHHLNRAEIACLKAIILFNPGMHFLEVSNLKGSDVRSLSVVIDLYFVPFFSRYQGSQSTSTIES